MGGVEADPGSWAVGTEAGTASGVGSGVGAGTGAVAVEGSDGADPSAPEASSRSVNSLSRSCWALASITPVPQSWNTPNSKMMSPNAMTVLPNVPRTRATATVKLYE